MRTMSLRVKPLTPIWTGGAEGKDDRIHETGIIGSMRWWFEALVRGMGGNSCAADNSCSNVRSDLHEAKSGLPGEKQCDVCRIFGAAGWRRRFRLIVQDEDGLEDEKTGGNFKIQVYSLFPDFDVGVIGGLIQFIADWGALGAKPQKGYGVIGLPDGRFDMWPLFNVLRRTSGTKEYPRLPTLKNMFFAHVYLKGANETDTFKLQYGLRRLFEKDGELCNFILGIAKDSEKIAAKIKISHPYGNGAIRVWGYIPDGALFPSGAHVDRGYVLEKIRAYLGKNSEVRCWREYGSKRDTIWPGVNDPIDYLKSLINM